MLTIENNELKQWSIIYNDEPPIKIFLEPSTITNKFRIVVDFIRNLSTYHGDEFDKWFFQFIKDTELPFTHLEESDKLLKRAKVTESEARQSTMLHSTAQRQLAEAVTQRVDKIKEYVDTYLTAQNIDYSKYVDESKAAKKNSILFRENEIDHIIRLSCYLKMYSFVTNRAFFEISQTFHRDVYNLFASEVIKTNVVSKIFEIIKTKTFRYNMSDKFMWDYIKRFHCKDVGVHVIEIFNFIMNNIIVLCEESRNPIIYFIGVVDESIKWFLRSVYKGTMVYEDEISTEDIHDSSFGDNLMNYSYNDTIGRLKQIAYTKIYKELEKQNTSIDQENYITTFKTRLEDNKTIKFISPLCDCMVFPILSQITEIPYSHFKTIPPDHAAVLSFYLNSLLTKVFYGGEFSNVFMLLDYYPETNPSTHTTYAITPAYKEKYIADYNKLKNFFGFNNAAIEHDAISHFIGRMTRLSFDHLLTGKKATGLQSSKIEAETAQFLLLLFSGRLESKIRLLSGLLDKDF